MKTQSGEIHDHSLLTILFASRAGKSSVRKCVDADQKTHLSPTLPADFLEVGIAEENYSEPMVACMTTFQLA